LPEAISEALGISLSEVLNLYFGELDEGTWDRLVWDAINRRRGEEEDMDVLREEVVGPMRPSSDHTMKMTCSSMIEISLEYMWICRVCLDVRKHKSHDWL
jgi:hypothetical protein